MKDEFALEDYQVGFSGDSFPDILRLKVITLPIEQQKGWEQKIKASF